MFNNHLMKACLAAVLVLGLAGCSSSSDDSSTEAPPTMEEGPTVAELMAVIAALRTQLGITDADDLGDSIDDLIAERNRLQMEVDDAADDAADAARAAMIATAAKLYAGISAPLGDVDSPAATDRAAAYNAAETGITVSNGDGTNNRTAELSEDKDAMVADNAGWEGKSYTRTMPAAEGAYEAVVYSNVEEPEEGRMFGSLATVTETGAFEYQLDGDGALGIDTSDAATPASRVGGSNFDQSAGTKRFMLPDNTIARMISGTFHGVAGTYSCTPTAGTTCAANLVDGGFELGTVAADNTFTNNGGTWTFTPTDAMARVMSAADTAYASYGWWLHKAANDGPFTASAFVDELGTVGAASGLDNLNGTATYVGGAAGQYALSSSTGGTNDAGYFTARATLEADFTNNDDPAAITGTIDMFKGADGESRNWEVALAGSTIGDTGEIGTATEGTTWTIDGTDADADGNWAGTLRNNGTDLVPQVATGTFYTEYGTAGKMVGAFGANKQ